MTTLLPMPIEMDTQLDLEIVYQKISEAEDQLDLEFNSSLPNQDTISKLNEDVIKYRQEVLDIEELLQRMDQSEYNAQMVLEEEEEGGGELSEEEYSNQMDAYYRAQDQFDIWREEEEFHHVEDY